MTLTTTHGTIVTTAIAMISSLVGACAMRYLDNEDDKRGITGKIRSKEVALISGLAAGGIYYLFRCCTK